MELPVETRDSAGAQTCRPTERTSARCKEHRVVRCHATDGEHGLEPARPGYATLVWTVVSCGNHTEDASVTGVLKCLLQDGKRFRPQLRCCANSWYMAVRVIDDVDFGFNCRRNRRSGIAFRGFVLLRNLQDNELAFRRNTSIKTIARTASAANNPRDV